MPVEEIDFSKINLDDLTAVQRAHLNVFIAEMDHLCNIAGSIENVEGLCNQVVDPYQNQFNSRIAHNKDDYSQ